MEEAADQEGTTSGPCRVGPDWNGLRGRDGHDPRRQEIPRHPQILGCYIFTRWMISALQTSQVLINSMGNVCLQGKPDRLRSSFHSVAISQTPLIFG